MRSFFAASSSPCVFSSEPRSLVTSFSSNNTCCFWCTEEPSRLLPRSDVPSISSSSATRCFSFRISAVAGSMFTTGLFWIFRACPAHRSVLSVSLQLLSAGDTHAIITVRALPPSESFSRRVRLLSR